MEAARPPRRDGRGENTESDKPLPIKFALLETDDLLSTFQRLQNRKWPYFIAFLELSTEMSLSIIPTFRSKGSRLRGRANRTMQRLLPHEVLWPQSLARCRLRAAPATVEWWSRRLSLPEMASGCCSFSIPCFRPETAALWHSCPANGKVEVACELVTWTLSRDEAAKFRLIGKPDLVLPGRTKTGWGWGGR